MNMAFRPPVQLTTSTNSSGGSFSIKDILDLPDERPQCESRINLLNVPEGDNPRRSCVAVRPIAPLALRPRLSMFNAKSLQLYSPWPFGPTYLPGLMNDPCGYPGPELLQGYNPNWRRSRRPLRKKKQRPLFSQQQVQILENEFHSKKYLTEEKRTDLSHRLKLTETQVKTWFQNRRTKWRKEIKIKEKASQTTIGAATCHTSGVEQDYCAASPNNLQERSSSPASSPRAGTRSPMFFIDLNSSKTNVMEVIHT